MQNVISKSLCTVALVGAATCAHADGLSFYALLDASVASTSISGPGTTASKTEFVTGGYAPNFAGIGGEKSLSSGLTGGFKLEQGFLLNQPAAGNSRFAFGDDSLFNRQAKLYLKGKYGTGALGTQPNIAFNSVLYAEPRFGSNYGSSLAAIVISGGLGTVDNSSVSYTSPDYSGVTLAAQVLTETSTVNSGYRLSGSYAVGNVKATLAAYTTDVIGEAKKRSGTVLGGSYRMGALDLKAMAVNQKNVTYADLTTLGVGGAYSVNGDLTLDFGIFRSSDSATSYKMETFAVGAQQKILKDLVVYAQYASVKNDGKGTTPYNFAPPTLITGGITAGQTASTFNIGLLYSFF